MKHRFEKNSALAVATPELVESVGKAMIVFAAIEGMVNFALTMMIQNLPVWRHIADTRISRRLDLFGDLVSRSPALTKDEVGAVIARAKELFRSRNLIAHCPLVTSGDRPEPRIHKLGGGAQKELATADILRITSEADVVYDDIRQLFFNCQRELSDAPKQ